MSMASNVIAYIGNDSFDIILYLSRILQKLGRRVLIVDYNEKSALTYSIPGVNGIDVYTEINTYMNVDFTRRALNAALIAEYDDVLIDCGFGEPIYDVRILTKAIYVSDMFRYTLEKLKHNSYYDKLPIKKELLIREAADINVTAASMTAILNKEIIKPEILFHDDIDYQNALICHYNQTVSFRNISVKLKEYLFKELTDMVTKTSYKQLKAAYNRAKRGDMRGVVISEHYPVLVSLPWAGANK